MFKKIILPLFILLLSLTLFAFSVSAQGDSTTNNDSAVNANTDEEQLTDEDPEVPAQDLEVEEVEKLPWLKDIFRDVQILVTFDPVKKSELQLKKASRQIIRLRRIVKAKPDDPKLQERLARMDQKYQKLIDKINSRIEKFKERRPDSPKLKSFLDQYTEHQLLHQEILQKLEEQVPEDVFAKIRERRQRHLKRFGQVMTRLQEKEELKKRLERILSNKRKRIEHRVRQMEILEELELNEAAPEAIKERIREIRQERKELFKELQEKRQEFLKKRQERVRELREQFREHRQEIQDHRQDIREQRRELQGEARETRREIREDRRNLMEKIKGIFRRGDSDKDENTKDEDEAGEASGNSSPGPSLIKHPGVCIQVVTPAKNPRTGECRDFPTPCDVPEGWQKVRACINYEGRNDPDFLSD